MAGLMGCFWGLSIKSINKCDLMGFMELNTMVYYGYIMEYDV